MPNTNVSLDVRNTPSNGSDGYTNTTASNGAVYSYRYGGGSDAHGNTNETVGDGGSTITVNLESDPRYQIADVRFSGFASPNLSTRPASNSATSLVIFDTDTTAGNSYYKITVSDSTANCTFDCDPEINNDPKK